MAALPKIVVIGAGNMGSLHTRVAAQSAGCELVAVVDVNEEIGSSLAERYGASWLPELGSLQGIDGVIVAAATPAHRELALQVIGSGVPLLVEKPIADNLAHTEEILNAAEAAKVPMMCGFVERYNPAVIAAKSIVNRPVYVSSSRHGPYAPRITTGVSWDLLVHDVDLAVQVLGNDVSEVKASRGFFHPSSLAGSEDTVDAVINFESGAVASVSASRISQIKTRTMAIHEIDRMVEIDLLRRNVTIYHHVENSNVTLDGDGYRQQTIIEIPEILNHVEPLAGQLSHFLGLINGTVDADAERAGILPAHRVVDAVQRAATN